MHADQASARAARAPVNSTYEVFMGVLSILAIGVSVWMLVSMDETVEAVLVSMDTLFCAIFLADFVRSFRRAPDKRAYLLPRGIMDLLGAVPVFPWMRFFRIVRLLRVMHLIQGRTPHQLATDFLARRQESAVYVITLAAILVLLFGGTLVVRFEADNPDANILSASDAIWWAVVTIATVGYGDRFPVTEGGRLIAVLTMAIGIGIFGVATSYLSMAFLGRTARGTDRRWEDALDAPATGAAPPGAEGMAALVHEIRELRDEVSALRAELAATRD